MSTRWLAAGRRLPERSFWAAGQIVRVPIASAVVRLNGNRVCVLLGGPAERIRDAHLQVADVDLANLDRVGHALDASHPPRRTLRCLPLELRRDGAGEVHPSVPDSGFDASPREVIACVLSAIDRPWSR